MTRDRSYRRRGRASRALKGGCLVWVVAAIGAVFLLSGCSALATMGEKVEVGRQISAVIVETEEKAERKAEETAKRIVKELVDDMPNKVKTEVTSLGITEPLIEHMNDQHESEGDIPWENRGEQGVILAMVLDRLNERRKKKKAEASG